MPLKLRFAKRWPHCFDRARIFYSRRPVFLSTSVPGFSCAFRIKKRKNFRARKNKTHKTLSEKIFFGITLRVTEVAAFETNEGIGERSRETLGESSGRAVCRLLLTPIVEAERPAREDRKIFLSARIKTGSALWEGPAEGEPCRSTKVEPRCRGRNRRWRTATKKQPKGTTFRKEREVCGNRFRVSQGIRS